MKKKKIKNIMKKKKIKKDTQKSELAILTEEYLKNEYLSLENSDSKMSVNEVFEGMIEWFHKGYLEKGDVVHHRLDGPALVCVGSYSEWYFNGESYSEEDHPFNVFRKQYNLSEKYEEWSTDMKMLFKLTYDGEI